MGDNEGAGQPEVGELVDARGLACPLPVLKLRKALKAALPGSRWTLFATDPAAMRDVPAFCAAAGHQLIGQHREAGCLRFVIQAAGGSSATTAG